jgi:hypothetical protein
LKAAITPAMMITPIILLRSFLFIFSGTVYYLTFYEGSKKTEDLRIIQALPSSPESGKLMAPQT